MRILAVLVLLFGFSGGAFAHPHQYIDLRVKLHIDAQNRLAAITQTWIFDAFYTELSLPDFDVNSNKVFDEAELAELARQNLLNLKDYSYFTTVEKDGAVADFSNAQPIATVLEGGRVAMTFETPLAAPVDAPFIYSIYDPSYYVEMKHLASGGIDAGACKADITKPNPDAVYTALAASLDKNATAPENLGKHFAERVLVTCP